MAIIPKILQKINPSYRNYQLLIEHTIPILFTIDKNTDTFIGFVNVYRPGRGQLAITLSKTTKDTIQNLNQTNGKLNPLFLNSVHYNYNKGIITETPHSEEIAMRIPLKLPFDLAPENLIPFVEKTMANCSNKPIYFNH